MMINVKYHLDFFYKLKAILKLFICSNFSLPSQHDRKDKNRHRLVKKYLKMSLKLYLV